MLSTIFDFIHRTMTKNLKDQKDTGEVKAKISYLANTYVNSYKPTKNALQKHKILKKLRNNNNILITKPDKGNGVIIVYRIYYMSSMYEIVNDSSKFLKLRSDPTICRENKLQRFLHSLKNKDFSLKIFMTTYILVGPNRLRYMVILRHINLNLRQIS